MSSDYFSSDDFKDLLSRYQNMRRHSIVEYFDVDDIIDLSDYYMEYGNVADAIDALGFGIKTHPNNDQLKIVLAGIEVSQNNYRKADLILKSLNDGESLNDYYYVKAQLLLTIHADYDKANHTFNKWLELEFDEIERNNSHDDVGDLKRECYIHIITSVRELVSDFDTRTLSLVYWINQYVDTFADSEFGSYEKDINVADLCRYENLLECCEKIFILLLKNQPYLESGWTILATAQYSLGKYEESNESVDFALAINPNDLDAIMVKAHASFAMGNFIVALDYYKQYKSKTLSLIRTDETGGLQYCECDLYIGITLWKSGKITESKDYIKQAIRWNETLKNDTETYSWNCKDIAEWLIVLAQYEEAKTIIDKGLEIQPHNIEFLQIKAEILFQLNNNDAYNYLQESIDKADNKLNAILSAGLRLLNTERYDESIEYFNDALEFTDQPNHIHSYAFLSYVYYRKTDIVNFLHYLKLACKLCPNVLKMFFEKAFPYIPPEEYYEYIVKTNNLQI